MSGLYLREDIFYVALCFQPFHVDSFEDSEENSPFFGISKMDVKGQGTEPNHLK